MSTGHELLARIATLPIEVVSIEESDFAPDGSIEMVLCIPAGDVERDAIPLLFAIAVLSYSEARPREVSEIHYDAGDQWTVHDLVEHLRFRRGALVLDTDYVRGRMMKTEVEVERDGTVRLRVVNRASSAKRWIAMLQGHGDTAQQLSVVGEDPGRFFAPDGVDPDPSTWATVGPLVARAWADAAAEGALPPAISTALAGEPRLAGLTFRRGVLGEEILPCRPHWRPVVAHLTVYAQDALGNDVVLVVLAPPGGLGPSCTGWAGGDSDRRRQVDDLLRDLLGDGEPADVPFAVLEQAWAAVQQAADHRRTRAALLVYGTDATEAIAALAPLLGVTDTVEGGPIAVPEEIDGVRLWLVPIP
jgi:hypothetical protein